ncbi:hypothetical protein SUNI508_11752 [Seiridium unicorne]|uniref:Clr5 domain-containing protein n=1 Tax=Seiridium unicorne TaxID=138068 RepID=A0ABR2UGK2_9PEZI
MSFFDSSVGEPPMPVNLAQPYHQGRETSSSIWQQNRELLGRLYQQERKTLREVKRVMEEQHGFPSFPMSTYETKLRDELGLKKKLKATDWIAIHQRLVAEGDRKCEVHLNGVPIPQWKVKKEIKRNLRKFSLRGELDDLPLRQDIIIHPLPLEVDSRDSQQSTQPLSDALEVTQPNHIIDPFNDNIFSIGFPELDGLRSPSDMLLSLDAPFQLPMDWNGDDMVLDWPDGTVTPPALLVETTPRISSSLIQGLQQLKIPVPLTKTLEIVAAFARSTSYASHASILHPEFKKLWSPYLDDLPIFRFQSIIDNIDYSSVSSFLHSGLAIPNEQLVPGAASQSELSLSMSPFYILSTALYYLSNNFREALQMEQIIEWFSSKVPASLARSFLRLPSLSMRESWITLLDSAFVYHNRSFFLEVANAAVEENDWLRTHGAWCLVLAAGLDCASLCRQLIALGVSPDEPYSFFKPHPQAFQYNDSRFLQDASGGLARVEVNVAARRSTSSQLYRPMISTLPLIEATMRGNIEAAEVLLESGAKVNHRCDGMTAAGYIVLALRQDNVNTESRIQTLRLLLEKGEDVDEPAWEDIGLPAWTWKRYIPGSPDPGLVTSSEETLLDIVYLTQHDEALALVTKFSLVPDSILTVSKVISSAKLGVMPLRSCLDRARFPKGVHRRRIQRAALLRSIDTPKVALAILLAKVDVEDHGSSYYHDFGFDGYIHERMREAHGFNLEHSLLHYFLSSPVTADTAHIAIILMEHLDISGDREIMLFVQAAKQNNFETVGILLQRGIDVNGVMRSGEYKGMSVMLLTVSRIELPSVVTGRTTEVASVEMLELLYGAGATIPACNHVIESTSNTGMPCRFYPAHLQWLFERGFETPSLRTKSIFTILMEMVDCKSADDTVLELIKHLDGLNIPPCNPGKTLGDPEKRRYESAALVFFITIGTGLEFCHRLINTGPGLNESVDIREWLRLQSIRPNNPIYNQEWVCLQGMRFGYFITPLGVAVRSDNLELVRELIRCGADVTRSGSETALQIACSDSYKKRPNRLEIAHCLLLNGADPNTVGHGAVSKLQSRLPLYLALDTLSPNAELVELLLKFGATATANATSKEFGYHARNAIFLALSCQEAGTRRRLVDSLIHHGPGVDIWLEDEVNSCLFKACEKCDIEMISLLLARGACPNSDHQTYYSTDIFGSPLALLAMHGNIPAALLLLEAGAVLSDRDNSLEVAAEYERLDMVQLLLRFETRKEAFIRAIGNARLVRRFAIEDIIRRRMAEVYSGAYEEIITNRISEAHIDGTMDNWDKEDTMYLVRYGKELEDSVE